MDIKLKLPRFHGHFVHFAIIASAKANRIEHQDRIFDSKNEAIIT